MFLFPPAVFPFDQVAPRLNLFVCKRSKVVRETDPVVFLLYQGVK